MKNIIFIGSCYPEGMQSDLIKLGSVVDFAGNTFQMALLKGMDYFYDNNFKVISSALTSAFPKIKVLNFKKLAFSHKGEATKNDVYVGAFNIPLIKLFSKYKRVKKELKSSLKDNAENCVIVYSVHTPFILAAYKLRAKIDKLIIVVPDLPEYMSANGGCLRKLLKQLDISIINFCLKSFNGFVLLSPYMKDKLPIGKKTWLQFEGIYQVPLKDEKQPKEEQKTIMYTGNIYKKRGVDILLNAFSQIDKPNYRLWIRGNGDMKETILQMSKADPRIIYFEPMDREELLKMEQRATLMVNPTPASWEFTKYFFPSKTMEYMASGTPTLMFKLACLPEEYEPYLFFSEESVEALRDKMIEICEKPQEELDRFGEAAAEFIINRKNEKVQAERILNMLDEL